MEKKTKKRNLFKKLESSKKRWFNLGFGISMIAAMFFMTKTVYAKDVVVVLDPGHGGSDPGAISVISTYERDYNLKIAKYCKEELDKYKGITTYLTRTSNSTALTLSQRADIGKNKNADILISMHNNSGSAAAKGCQVYVTQNTTQEKFYVGCKRLGNYICSNLNGLGLVNRGVSTRNYGSGGGNYPFGGAWDYYGVIRNSMYYKIPGIIIEHAFVSNASDVANFLSSDSKLKKLGVADAQAILKYYGITETKTVTPKLSINKQKATLYKGEIESIVAKYTNAPDNATISYTSSNEQVATVDSDGNVTAVGTGEAVITVSGSGGEKTTCVIQVLPESSELQEGTVGVQSVVFKEEEVKIEDGEFYTQTPTVEPENAANKKLQYHSSNTDVAEVDENGTVTTKAAGYAYITARSTDGTGIVAKYKIQVIIKTNAVSFDEEEMDIMVGSNKQLKAEVYPGNATDSSITWTTADSNVATVTQAGKVKGVNPGVTYITTTTKDSNVSASCKVVVHPKGTSIKFFSTHATNQKAFYLKKNKTYSFKTNVYPANALQTVTYSSSNKKVATISSKGKIKAVRAGKATITIKAKYGNAKKKVTVYVASKSVSTKKISFTKSKFRVAVGKKVGLTSKITPKNTQERLYYSCSNTKIATVSKYGFVKGKKKGTVTITVRTSNGRKAKCKVKVVNE